MYINYGQTEMDWLKKRDKKLAAIIDRRGFIKRKVYGEPFPALLRAIIGQQISGKAQDSIWTRFMTAYAPLEAAKIASIDPQVLRQCGISGRKASYIVDIAGEFAHGSLCGIELDKLADEELRSRLTGLRGIGAWTVDMLLIFSFQRKNVLSYGDMGIQRGLKTLYGHKELTPALFAKYHKRYSPHATIASLYLWELAGGNVPDSPCQREN